MVRIPGLLCVILLCNSVTVNKDTYIHYPQNLKRNANQDSPINFLQCFIVELLLNEVSPYTQKACFARNLSTNVLNNLLVTQYLLEYDQTFLTFRSQSTDQMVRSAYWPAIAVQ